jgi:hypothetical protein
MTALLWKAGIVHNPAHDFAVLLQDRQDRITYLPQDSFIAPWGVRYDMVQRLMRPPNIIRGEPGRNRFHTLALTGQQQAGTVVLQWNCSIYMPCGLRQAFHKCRKALLLWAWRG